LESAILTIDGSHLISEEDALYFTKIKKDVSPKENGTSATLQKDVTYRDIKIVVDGNEITPTDANGNPVEPFIMDGTTYLPVRAVANAFGKEVGWDDTTNTVYLGTQLAESNNVLGTYVMVTPDPTERFTLILKENYKASLSDGYNTVHVTWSQSGNILTLIPPSGIGDFLTLIIDGDRLISGEEGDEEAFIKTDSVANPMAQVTMKTVTVDKTDANKPIVTIEMETGGIIKMELYPDVAPITVENFISLIEKGFYDDLTFHRNIPGFVIQGGCPVGNGTGGPGYTIKGEFASNGVKNDLKHTRGVLSMARAMDPDSAGSQFFIMHADAPHLDGEYAAFGMVIEGMDVVDAIATSGM
jgi:peptidyl-prolyl cis-trans isomerase B (cyclophilin B)